MEYDQSDYSRRQALQLFGGVVIHSGFKSLNLASMNAWLHQVLGLHFNPTGHADMPGEFKIAEDLRAVSCTVINPSDEVMRAIAAKGFRHPTVRVAYGQKEREEPLKFIRAVTARAVRIIGAGVLIQPFNEFEKDGNVKGLPISPADHVEQELLPAIKEISDQGAITVITPLADRSWDQQKNQTLAELMTTLRTQLNPNLRSKVVYGAHPYSSSRADNPIARVLSERRFASQMLDYDLPIVMPEFGIQEDLPGLMPDTEIAEIIMDLLKTNIAPEDKVLNCNLWTTTVLAGTNLRGVDADTIKNWEKYEQAALRKKDGKYHPLYYSLKNERQLMSSASSIL